MSVQCDLFTTYNTLKLSFEILLLLTVSINIVKIYEWIRQVFIIRYDTCTHIALEHYNIPLYYPLQLRLEDGWQILHNSYIYTSFLNTYFSKIFKKLHTMYMYTECETSSLVVHVISFKVGPLFCESAQEFTCQHLLDHVTTVFQCDVKN